MCISICMYVYMYICIYVYLNIYIFIYVYIYMYVCIYVYMYICIYVYVYVYMYTYKYMYVCIYVLCIYVLGIMYYWGYTKQGEKKNTSGGYITKNLGDFTNMETTRQDVPSSKHTKHPGNLWVSQGKNLQIGGSSISFVYVYWVVGILPWVQKT